MGFCPVEEPAFSGRAWPDFLETGVPEVTIPGWRVLSWLGAFPGQTLLDLGASGSMLRCASQSQLKATGLEFFPEAAAMAQKNAPEAVVFIGSMGALPFDDGFFDFVTCLGASCSPSNPACDFSEIYRVLKPGGRICLLLPISSQVLKTEEKRPDEWERGYTCKTWSLQMEQAGFQIRGIWPFNHPGRRNVFENPGRRAWLTPWHLRFWERFPWVGKKPLVFLAEKPSGGAAPTRNFRNLPLIQPLD